MVAADAQAEEFAGRALDLQSLGLQRTLQEPIAVLKVPVAAPQQVNAAHGEEMRRWQPLQKRLKLI